MKNFSIIPATILLTSSYLFATDSNVLELINLEEYTIQAGDSLSFTGKYHATEAYPSSITKVGTLTVNGTLISQYTATAMSMIDVQSLNGSGTFKVASGSYNVYLSPEADTSGFTGNISMESAGHYLGFTGSKNNLSNASLSLVEGSTVSFSSGNFVLGNLSGAGLIHAEKSTSIYKNIDGTVLGDSTLPAVLSICGDISNFTGSYQASRNSSIKLETALSDKVKFEGTSFGTLELIGAEGDARKTIEVSATPTTNGSSAVYMYGNTPVIAKNSNDGKIGTIYLGGNDAYIQNEKVVYNLNSQTVLDSTAGNIVIGGRGSNAKMANGSEITVSDNVSVSNLVVGGGDKSIVNGTVSVTVNSGTIGDLSGGENSIHTGDTIINVNGGTISNVYAADKIGGVHTGKATVNMTDGNVGAIVGQNYNASLALGTYNQLNSDIEINVSGGTVSSYIRGLNTNNQQGETDITGKMVINGDVTINVSGNAVVGDNDEAILASGGSYSAVNGNTTVNISENAVINGNIVSGGSKNTTGVKNTFVNVSGGTINGNIIAGSRDKSVILGDTNILISGGFINGNVYGGGGKESNVNGNVNITITGDVTFAEASVISGLGSTETSTISGSRNLNIESFTGSNKVLNAVNFDNLSVRDTQNLELTNALALQNLTIDSSSKLSLTNATIESFTLEFDTGFDEGNVLDLTAFDNVISNDGKTIVLSALAEENAGNFSVVNADGVEFKLVFNEQAGFSVGSVIPEPSTYATVFGVFALAFVAYRRRK